ncbi:MAG: methyltransferase domain-containing protein [Neisseriaceae bacterium]
MHRNSYTLIKNRFNKNAAKLHMLDFIYREIAKRMVTRLNYIKINPSRILDIGSGLGIDSELLQHKFQKSIITKLDLAIEILKLKLNRNKNNFLKQLIYKNRELICGNAINLPIASQSIDLVWSNLVLPYIDQTELFLKEIRRVLAINGSFLISGLAVDSLKQIRDIGLTTYNFPDMHVIGDLLVKLGFTNPVTDVEYINIEYDNIDQLLNDIRLIGCGGVSTKTTQITRQDYLSIKNNFAQITKNGVTPLTLEVFYAHAWKDKVIIDAEEGKNIIHFYPKA